MGGLPFFKDFNPLKKPSAFDLTSRCAERIIPGMNATISTGLTGMKAAETRAELRAVNIVQAPIRDARQFTSVQTAKAACPAIRVQSDFSLAPGGPFPDLAEDIVDLKSAAHAYRASAAVVRAGLEMERTLLDTVS